jgi:hypothetical protein
MNSAERALTDGCYLSRADLLELGFGTNAVEAIFRHCPVINLPGQRRVFIRSDDFRACIAAHTYDGARVRRAA